MAWWQSCSSLASTPCLSTISDQRGSWHRFCSAPHANMSVYSSSPEIDAKKARAEPDESSALCARERAGRGVAKAGEARARTRGADWGDGRGWDWGVGDDAAPANLGEKTVRVNRIRAQVAQDEERLCVPAMGRGERRARGPQLVAHGTRRGGLMRGAEHLGQAGGLR